MALKGDLGLYQGYKYLLVVRFTIYYTESVIYIMSLDIIRETTATVIEFNSVQVHQVILQ